MTRTNIDIDDDLVARVMEKYSLRTKREAVNFALERTAGPAYDPDFARSFRGVGWDGNLEEMRRTGVEDVASADAPQ
ncbi:MAG: type II toxin-antitoxin system VapB family antitoxin [Nocardioides sp.]